MNKNVLVLPSFPGTGKSYFCKKYNSKRILDSDSSYFSWKYNYDKTRTRNTDFPYNYLYYIQYWIDQFSKEDSYIKLPGENIFSDILEANMLFKEYNVYGIIFTSTHKDVINVLRSENIKFVSILPDKESFKYYNKRYIERNDSKKFISVMKDNYTKFIDDIIEKSPKTFVLHGSETIDSSYSKILNASK